MKRLITIISLLALVSGCNSVGGAVAVINPLNFTSTGFYPLLIIGELETNLSSLVIDKTFSSVAFISCATFVFGLESNSVPFWSIVRVSMVGSFSGIVISIASVSLVFIRLYSLVVLPRVTLSFGTYNCVFVEAKGLYVFPLSSKLEKFNEAS